jgi:hypothetical protein
MMADVPYTLNSLRISRDIYRKNSPLRCSVEFAGLAGKVADMKAAFVEGAAQAMAIAK